MDYSTLAQLLAAGIPAAAHTGGHFYEAEQQGLPASLNLRNLTEDVGGAYRSPNKEARFANAGFQMQDQIAPYFDQTNARVPVRLGNALYKLLYPQMVNKMATSTYEGGDLGALENVKGKTYGQEALAISALADLYKAASDRQSNNNWNLGYWQDPRTGTPGLQLTGRW